MMRGTARDVEEVLRAGQSVIVAAQEVIVAVCVA